MDITTINIGEFEHRLLLAFTLGTVIGLERQWRHKIAGIKTNALVAGGAALFILVSEKMSGDSTGAARIAANIVTGIGFLGAGVMMRNGSNITGINTAATIWCSSAIGSLAGLGYWYESLVGTAFVVLGNIILRPIGDKIDHRLNQIKASGNVYFLKIQCQPHVQKQVKSIIIEAITKSITLHLSAMQTENHHLVIAEIQSLDQRHTDIEAVVDLLKAYPDIESVKWEEQQIKYTF